MPHPHAFRKPVPSAQFEIAVDGKPRSYRDRGEVAIEAAEHLKRRHPQSDVRVKNLVTGEVTVAEHKPDLGPIFPWV